MILIYARMDGASTIFERIEVAGGSYLERLVAYWKRVFHSSVYGSNILFFLYTRQFPYTGYENRTLSFLISETTSTIFRCTLGAKTSASVSKLYSARFWFFCAEFVPKWTSQELSQN